MENLWVLITFSSLNILILATSVVIIYRQLKINEKSTMGNTYQSMRQEGFAINRIFVDNPELGELWGDVEYVGSKGDLIEIRKAWVITMILDYYENLFFQNEQGILPAEAWERWRKHIINVFKKAKIQDQWNRAKIVYYKPFREFIEQSIKDD